MRRGYRLRLHQHHQQTLSRTGLVEVAFVLRQTDHKGCWPSTVAAIGMFHTAAEAFNEAFPVACLRNYSKIDFAIAVAAALANCSAFLAKCPETISNLI
jgi:hypothetical protein